MRTDETAFYKWVGKKITLFRKERNLTQAELGKKIDLSRVSIVNIEKGRQTPPLFTFWVLAKELNVDPIDILPLKNEYILPDNNNIVKKVSEMNDLDENDKNIISDLFK